MGEFDNDSPKTRAGGATWSNSRGTSGELVVVLPDVKQKAIGKANETVTQRILKANGVNEITKKAKEKKAVVIPPGPGMLVAPGAPPAAPPVVQPAQPPATLAGLPPGVGRQRPPTLAPAIEVEDTRVAGCCGLFGGRAPPPRPPALVDAKGDDGRGGGGTSSGNSASGQVGPGAAGPTGPAIAAARPVTASGRGAPSLFDSTFRQANQSIKRVPQSARARSASANVARGRSAGSDGIVSNWDDVDEGEFEELESDEGDDLLDDHDEDEVTALGPTGSSRQTTAAGEAAAGLLGGGDGPAPSSVGTSRAGTAKSLALSTYTAASSKAPTKSILKSAASKRDQGQNSGGVAGLAAVSIDGEISNGNGSGMPCTTGGSGGASRLSGGGAPQMRISAGGTPANLIYGAGGGADGRGMLPPGYAPSASAPPTDYLNPTVAGPPPGELLLTPIPPIGAGLAYVTGGGVGFYSQPVGGGAAPADWPQPPVARLSGAGAGGSGNGAAAGAVAAAAVLAPGAGAASLSAATATRPGNNMMVTAEQLLDVLMAQGKITEHDVQGAMGMGMQQQQPVASTLYPTLPQTQAPQLQAAVGVAGTAGPNPFSSGGGGSGGGGSGSSGGGGGAQPQQFISPGQSPDHSTTNAPRFMIGAPGPAAMGPALGPGPGLATHGSLHRDVHSRVRFGVNQVAPPPGTRQLTHSNTGGPGDLPPPVAPPAAAAAAAAVSESLMATSPCGSGGAGAGASSAVAPARAGLAVTSSQRVRFIDEAGPCAGSGGGSGVGSPLGPRSPDKTTPEAMTPVEIGPGPGYNPQGVLSAATAALGVQPAPPGAGLPAPPAAPAATISVRTSPATSPSRVGGFRGELGMAAAAAAPPQHGTKGGSGGSRSASSPHTASSALLPGGGPPPHPVSAGGAPLRDPQHAPPSPLGPAGGGALQMRYSGGPAYMPTHTHAYGHSSKAPAGFAAAAAAALATPSPPVEKVGHMVAQGVAPPQGSSPMRITAPGAYGGGPGTAGAAGGGGSGGGQALARNTSGSSNGSTCIRIGSAGSAASATTSRNGYGGGQQGTGGGAREGGPAAAAPAAAGSGAASGASHLWKKVSEAATAAATLAAAAGGSVGGMGAVERLAALKLQSHMRGGASGGGAIPDGAHGMPGADATAAKNASRGAGSNWMSDGGIGASDGHPYNHARAQDPQQQEHGQGAAPAIRLNGGRSVRWTAAVVYEIDPGEVEDVANCGSNQSINSVTVGPGGGAGGHGGGAGAAEDGGGGRSKGGRGGGWM
ncbi:hypothetical protein HYH02_004723 [Chlamydomonas schloesseri]|uniref:Uncharacterized protein n=1 Tax=Chlamydomonas schloesseri TaxID=2026947 RepID=A0A836B8H1_9CHLO|nr:hypothetical protein HYH02_004723 [Chlamydomonas schloesseri]|eukprot:KAG2450891.1 hypothetical protein HYH02_004723 [Chlamydomonas schloesseri]